MDSWQEKAANPEPESAACQHSGGTATRGQELADIARLLDLDDVDSQEIRDAIERYAMLGFWHELEQGLGAD